MKNISETPSLFEDLIDFINSKDFESAIKYIRNKLEILDNYDDIALLHLNCGFLNDKLGEYSSAINDFTMAIIYEDKLDFLEGRSKDISLSGRSSVMYKLGDFKGAIEDKRKAKKLRLVEHKKNHDFKNIFIDYKNILLGTFVNEDLGPKYNLLIKLSTVKKKKYDLINDYKKVINSNKQKEIIDKLELLSEKKYRSGDFKSSIKAIRRSEKYY
tara:strand:- start:91 stop:732 length:642 start_codon:yes stop_codon:yes gene_type:complete